MLKRLMKLSVWILAILLLVFLGLFALLYRNMRPTKGPKIGAYASPRTALVVIDLQEDYTGPQARKRFRDGDRIVGVSNALLEQARAQGLPVIFVQNVVENPVIAWMVGGVNAPGAPGTEMDRRLARIPGCRTLTKTRSDAFSNPELDALLRGQQVNHLLITGLDAAYCVNATARGALNRGYAVTLYTDGIATESGKKVEELAEAWKRIGAKIQTGSKL
jgi:biuret amidohydrolase